SSFNAATLHERYGRTATVVHNGVDIEHFRPLAPEPTLRAELRGGQEHVVLLPGRMMPWKGHRHAIAALPAMPGVRLVVIGGGETRAELERQAAELGVTEQVLFTGVVPHRELPRYFAAADLAIGCSYASETFGMVLAEAMACGLPVLASAWPGYDDVVIDGETGARFPASDPAGLAAAVMALLGDHAARRRYADAGGAHVRRSFAWERIAANVEAAYGAIGESGGRR
ncbi:MAG TPA: glycosyltransferase family 4 protein, partial [Herpetosiphonaceae bacterium]